MHAFKSITASRRSPAKPGRRTKKASPTADLTIVSDSGYASSSYSSNIDDTKPPPHRVPVRDSSAHRWSEVVPDSAALTFAAIWDPEEGIVAFTGAELLELSACGTSSDSEQRSPTSPSTRSFPTLKEERTWEGYSSPNSHRAFEKSLSAPMPLSDSSNAARVRRDTLSQLLNSFYLDVSGGAPLSQVRSRRASLAPSGSCLTRGGLTCTILESDTVTISTLAYFRETHQRFFAGPPSPGIPPHIRIPHNQYPYTPTSQGMNHTRTSSAILERSSNVPMFLRMKGSMLGRLQGYKSNRQFSCLENLDDGFEFDPLRTVYARWGMGKENEDDGEVTDEGYCDGEDEDRAAAKRSRAVLFSSREDTVTPRPRRLDPTPPVEGCAISITSWSALDMTDPFSTSQPKRLRKRRQNAYNHSDTPVPPAEVLARAEAPLPTGRSCPNYPPRSTSLYPHLASGDADTRSRMRCKGSTDTILCPRPGLHRALTAPSESIGKFVRDLGPRLRKMSYKSQKESRMRKAGWRRKSEVLEDERWVRIDVKRVGDGVVMS